MATMLNLTNSINWCKPFLKNQPITFANMEPALTSGNMILQTMIAAPFKWRSNRNSFSFQTITNAASPATVAQSDYSLYLPDFGFLEDQTITDTTCSPSTVYPLQGAFSLPMPTGALVRPTTIAAQEDDNAGNITFRTKELPNKVYTVNGTYQKKAPILLSLADTITPIPDEFGFIFNWGLLSVLGLLVNDNRFPIWEKYFIGRLLGVQDGLDAVAINIFLGLWENNVKSMARAQSSVQAGSQGRQQ